MKRGHQKLSLEDHKELATHIYAIRTHLSKMLDVANGKVSAKVIDALLSSSRLEREIIKLRMSLEEILFKELRDQASVHVYDGNVDAACQTVIKARDQWAASVFSANTEVVPTSPRNLSYAKHESYCHTWTGGPCDCAIEFLATHFTPESG